jgi:hypothetical protein
MDRQIASVLAILVVVPYFWFGTLVEMRTGATPRFFIFNISILATVAGLLLMLNDGERGWPLFVAPVLGAVLLFAAVVVMMIAAYFGEQYANARDWKRTREREEARSYLEEREPL